MVEHINIKNCKNLGIADIQNMIYYIYMFQRKPKFLKIFDKTKFESLNLIFGYKRQSLGKIEYNISLNRLHDLIFKISNNNHKSDISIFNKNNIRPFIKKNSMKFYNAILNHIECDYTRENCINEGLSTFESKTPYWMVSIDCEMVETIKYMPSANFYNQSIDKITECPEYITHKSVEEDINGEDENRKNLINPEIERQCCFNTETRQSELGRITILNNNGEIIYDKYVKPENEVIDYRSEYSGLTPDLLVNAISFESMKNDIQKIIGINTVIVGHSLENDMAALRSYHHLIIDTSKLYRGRDCRKIKLKELARKYLKKQIQVNEHCSIE
ncbi:Small RNA degrading nuclease 5, partial [Dictyocoela muelleri]